ncbi:MAG: peptide chain release factor N(5)-glutamine methyltransferase [Bacteroidota bacterium]|nr:peptide chain release factor N(5)-glutamine methyltransferase [Bacteroidota bacterium]
MPVGSSTIQRIKNKITDDLSGWYDKNEAKNIASLLIEHICQMDKTRQISEASYVPGDDELNEINRLFRKLMSGMPIQYVLGETEFYGRKFIVSPTVLIPRPETEEVVEVAINQCKNMLHPRILDIGTGSGIIAVTLAAELNDAEVFASDIADDILRVAKRNASLHQVQMSFICHDLWKQQDDLPGNLDCIVSNPPYVTEKEKKDMHQNVLNYEPSEALFVPDDDHVRFYKQIARVAKQKLHAGGMVVCEINDAFAKESMKCFADENFGNIFVNKDLNKKNRILTARKP